MISFKMETGVTLECFDLNCLLIYYVIVENKEFWRKMKVEVIILNWSIINIENMQSEKQRLIRKPKPWGTL